jgi:hypothetical protein
VVIPVMIESAKGVGRERMIDNLNKTERDLFEVDKTVIPEHKVMFASRMPKNHKEELKKNEVALKNILERFETVA